MKDSEPEYPGQFTSIVHQQCPQCRSGKIFKYPIYHPRFAAMYETCPNCGLKYEIEIGFFWGSMYISYGFTVIIGLITAVGVFNSMNDPEVWKYILLIGGVLVLFSPLIFRYSRILMLYMFGSINFNPKLFRKAK